MQTRRQFLAQIAAALAASGADKRWKTAIGLNGFGSSEQYYNKRYEYDTILDFARSEKFDGVEMWGGWREGYPDPANATGIRAMRSKVESFGLRIFSIQAGPRGVNPVSGDAGERRKYTDELKSQIRLAKELGGVACGLWPPAKAAANGVGEDQMIERFAGCVKPAAQYAVDQGVTLAIEGEPPLIINSPERYEKLFAAVGMKEFKVIFDPAHFDLLTGGQAKPEILLKRLGVERVGYVQFTDGDGTLRPLPGGEPGTSKHLPCGEGKYDIHLLIELLHNGGFDGWVQIDSWQTEDPFYASLAGKRAVDSVYRLLTAYEEHKRKPAATR